MATNLGYVPNVGTIVLSEGADWVVTLTERDENDVPVVWPASTTCFVEFPELAIADWTATVTLGIGTAAFNVDKAATTEALVPEGTLFRLYLIKGGTQDFLWFHGKVKRKESGR